METYTATLKGGKTYLPDFEANSMAELEAKIAKYFIDGERIAHVYLEAIQCTDDNGNVTVDVNASGLRKIEVEIEGQIIEAYSNHECWSDFAYSATPGAR